MSVSAPDDAFLDVNDAHLRVYGNVHADGLKLGQLEVVTMTSTGSTINFLHQHTAFTTTSNILVGTTNSDLFVDTLNSRVGILTSTPATTLDVNGTVTATSFSDGTSTLTGGTWSGSAASLTTAVNIGGVAFDGSASISLPGVDLVGDQNTTGSAAKLTTPVNIGGVAFDGSASISLPGVDLVGDQNTTGSAAKLTTPVNIGGVAFDGSASIVPTTFGGATFSGDVTVDTNTFHVDTTNNRVGIGTTSASTDLQIGNTSTKTSDTYLTLASDGGSAYAQGIRLIHHGTDDSNMYGWRIRGDDTDDRFHINYIHQGSHQTSALTIKSGGDVGIGTTSPGGPLHLFKLAPNNGDTGPGILFTRYSDTYGGCIWTESNNNLDGLYFNAFTNSAVSTHYGGTPAMVINSNGRMGVGTNNPATKLHLYDTTNEPTIALQHLSGTENNASTNILGNLALHYSARSGGYPSVGIRSIRRAGTWDDQADMEFYVRNGGNGEQTAMVINSGAHLNSAKVGIGVTTPSTILQIGNTSDTTSDTYLTIASDGGNAYAQGIRFIHHGTDDSNMYGWRIRGDDTDDSFHINRIDAGNQQRDAFTLNASGMLILNQGSLPGASSNTHGIRMKNTNNGDYWNLFISDNNHFRFAYNGGARGYVDQNDPNGQMNFTGQHRTFIKDTPFTEAENLEGLIVSADQNKYIKMSGGIEAGSNAITMNETLPVVSVSVTAKDKKCFGVISASEDPETRTEQYGVFGSTFEKEKGDTRVYINSVGEGAIWVVNTNGLLESGDYITTSNVAGYGQKQDSEFLANYTVAKITMDCDFDPVTQPVQVIKKDEDGENILDEHGQIQWEDDPSGATEKAYKIRYLDADGNITDEANAVHTAAFVGCTYHCG